MHYYSQAIVHNNTVYVSGCIGLVPETMTYESDTDVEVQANQVLKNMRAILEASGSAMNQVLKTTILLADMGDFAKVNKVYETHFGDHKPARSTFAVKALPKNALVEIECIAYIAANSTNASKM
eukprot:GEZU01023055.1.p1 GENE.GEZU01023055.1~~GEZU01023055.1.p1  ORF type:complete len:124 (-),score=53.71 GEZU01023055.1:149-520(-)